ncbi:hypothetical protein [Desertibacillus haloalkaliphilus]|nr:hypothetical protein [Desertibacillus haloalkaliphilus]
MKNKVEEGKPSAVYPFLMVRKKVGGGRRSLWVNSGVLEKK